MSIVRFYWFGSIPQGRFLLYSIAPDGKELQGCTQIHEDMEDRMHPFSALTQTVEDGADGVGNAACQQEHKSRQGQGFDHLRAEGNDSPAHADVADHGEDSVLLQINGSEGGGQQTTSMKQTLQYVDAAWSGYTEAQKTAVKELCSKFYDVVSLWDLKNIFPIIDIPIG